MSTIHFLNVLEGDCNIIQHDLGRVSVIDVSNASNEEDTISEIFVKTSAARAEMKSRTQVPTGKKDYKQKENPENPINYIKNTLNIDSIFRFIITHPDMDHLDGIRDLFDEFQITNTWDSNNNKSISDSSFNGKYNPEDWKFYTQLRDGSYTKTKRLTYTYTADSPFWNSDDIKILAPSDKLIASANTPNGDIHDLSYVLLFTPPKTNGGKWKILFGGDSDDATWEHILATNKEAVSNIDVLFAPHHGRDSGRNYEFLKTLNPRLTLFGNASSQHLAYDKYPQIRITNNQAGNVILDIQPEGLTVYVQNQEFAKDFKIKRGWSSPAYSTKFKGYGLIQFSSQ